MEAVATRLLVGQTDRVEIPPDILLRPEPYGLVPNYDGPAMDFSSLIHGGVGMGVGLFSEILTFHLHGVLMNHGQTFESEIQWYDVFTG